MKKESTTTIRASQLSLRDLSILHWLLGAPEGSRRFVVASGSMIKLFETGEARDDGKFPVTTIVAESNSPEARSLAPEFGGKIKPDLDKLFGAGMLARHSSHYPAMPESETTFADKVADIFIAGKWTLGSVYYEIAGDWVGEWFRLNGAPRRGKLLEALAAKTKAVTRRAVFGRRVRVVPRIPESLQEMLPKCYHMNLPEQTILRPCVVATVIGETEKRLKVEDIQSINGMRSDWLGVSIKREQWFEREYLMLDNVSDVDVSALAAFDEEYVREVQELADQAISEIVPVLARMGDRLNQKEGQHADMLADLLSELAARKGG